eukprot:7777259-Ditylum_brightwellii.AAC.1
MERSKENKHAFCDKDNYVDNVIDNGDDDSVDSGDKSADKHITHLSQAADCCLAKRSKQNKH